MNDIAIVIITYNPNKETLERVNFSCEDFTTIIYKNSADDLQYPAFVEIKGDGNNKGLAEPLNNILFDLLSRNYKYMLFFDQDTSFSKKTLEFIVENVKSHPNCAIINFNNKRGSNSKEVKYIINSGTVFNLKEVSKVKGFREDFFVDLIDYDLCYKISNDGGKIISVPGTPDYDHKNHQSEKIKKIFGFKFTLMKYYSPIRVSAIRKNSEKLIMEMIKAKKYMHAAHIAKFILIFFATRFLVKFSNKHHE